MSKEPPRIPEHELSEREQKPSPRSPDAREIAIQRPSETFDKARERNG